MYGEDFAKLIKDYSASAQLQSSGIGVIKSNSDKSKHLETATIRVEGQWIDFVNLRSEKYTEDSRVPQIEIGTPEEDAFRRDLTINSMFFNINE
jgi:tRNA nucleotidyltransferase (CCA-adding enzyme)